MTERPKKYYEPDDELDLREIFAAAWKGKWIAIAFMIITSIAGTTFALSKEDIYKATVLLAPANVENQASDIRGQIGGLASLAGINLGRSGANQSVLAIEILQSHSFLSDFIKKHRLEPLISAVKEWDKDKNEFIYDSEIYDAQAESWLAPQSSGSEKPTDWSLVRAFRNNHLLIEEDIKSGLVTVSISHYAPETAKDWANMIVADLNERMRKQDIKEANASIEFLKAKLNETSVSEMQQLFYRLIENESRKVMLANVRPDYVFKIVDPAIAPQDPSEPKRIQIIFIFMAAGGGIGIAMAILVTFLSSSIKSKANKSFEKN